MTKSKMPKTQKIQSYSYVSSLITSRVSTKGLPPPVDTSYSAEKDTIYVDGNVGYLAGQPFLQSCNKLCDTKLNGGTCAFVSNRWTEGGSPSLKCSTVSQSGSNCYCCGSNSTYNKKTNTCSIKKTN